jgi:hypothetical protein
MGREVRRVPLDFDWPVGKVWDGFVNPHYVQCPDCRSGSTASKEALGRLVHLILIAGSDSIRGAVHPWLREAGINSVGKDFHELTAGLAGRAPRGALGHDGIDRWSATKKIIAAAGLPEGWGTCKTCGGHAVHPDHREAYESWGPGGPPTGEGWQLWETVSEGSPITPVYTTAEELIDHMCSGPPNSLPRDTGWSREVAELFVKGDGWAPSLLVIDGKMTDGVTAMAAIDKEGGGDAP